MKMRKVIAALVAALSIGAGAFLAMQPTAIAQQRPSAREYQTQQTHYYRKTVTFNEAYASGAQSIRFGRLPANASVQRYMVQVNTAFNGTGANRIYIGAGNFASGGAVATISAANFVLAAQTDDGPSGRWTSGTVGITPIITAANFGTRLTSAGAVDLWVNYSGVSATAGSATFTIEYILDNDL